MREPAKKPPFKKSTLVLVSILFTLVVLEIGTRIWLAIIPEEESLQYSVYSYLSPDDQRYVRHHYLNYYPNPHFKRGKAHHNSLGFRNDEFPREKPEGVFRIAVLGGSTTYNIGINDNDKTFTAVMERELRDKYGYENVEVINAGVGGYNSWETLINLEFRVLDIDPDLVIEYEGTNDVHARFVDPASYKSDDSGRRKQWDPPPVPILEHSALFRVILRKTGITKQVGIGNFVTPDTAYGPYSVAKHDPMELLDKNPPIFFERNLRNMVAITKAGGVDMVFVTWAWSPYMDDYASTPHYQRGFREMNEVLEKVAAENGIPLFDFEAVMPDDKKYWGDGRHENELGAEIKGELFAKFLHENGLIKKSPDAAQDK
ncbi:MAG TPA: SGNH/GDSL hydrolase family protein [Thermodesulfobacteriota bacterium]|nr:SGNH/GDSL hydrolase family protein [Thermodesulfobacteriota bacterium]